MLRIAVCDDNSATLTRLTKIVHNEFCEHKVNVTVDSFSRASSLLEANCTNSFDVIFLDIDMPDVNGLEAASALRRCAKNTIIIFVTSYAELIFTSLDFQPFNFIVKDYDAPLETSTARVIDKLVNYLNDNKNMIVEDDTYGKRNISLKEIVYIESDKHYVIMHLSNDERPVKIRATMQSLENNLKKHNFVRIHKTCIINLNFVSYIDSKESLVVMKFPDIKLPLSKSLRKEFDSAYTTYLKNII